MWGRKKTSCDGVANKNIFDSKLCNDFTNGSSKASFHQPRLRPKSFKKKPSPVGLGTTLCDFLFSSSVTTITRRMETPLFLFLVCFSLDQFVLIISPFISTIWFCFAQDKKNIKTLFLHTFEFLSKGKQRYVVRREHWSTDYGRRLVFQRLGVRIPAPFTGWTFFDIYLR